MPDKKGLTKAPFKKISTQLQLALSAKFYPRK